MPGGSVPGAAGVSFGDLENVCGPGTASTATDRGVTATEIAVSTFSDIGFSKKSEFIDTAEVFTAWCNEAGGINGRKLVSNTRDSKLTEDRQRMIEACASDFAVVGGGAAFDQGGVKERLKCLMPEIPGQTVSVQNIGSDLQVAISDRLANASNYEGYFGWLINEAYPDSKGAIGIISGDVPVTKIISDQHKEVIEGLGGTVAYYDLYPASGASDWTPYAQAIKSANIKGLVFVGDYGNLAKLEQSLTDIDYSLDFIDTNSNAYTPEFIELAKPVIDKQNNVAPLSIYPLEEAAANPATQQLLDLFAKYKPEATISLPAVRGFSAWLLFAVAARDCGDQLTRKCLFENANTYSDWTGGGLTAPLDAGAHAVGTETCWTAMTATPDGWTVADVKPDSGAFRCTTLEHPYTGDYGKPATLADVGLTLDDLP